MATRRSTSSAAGKPASAAMAPAHLTLAQRIRHPMRLTLTAAGREARHRSVALRDGRLHSLRGPESDITRGRPGAAARPARHRVSRTQRGAGLPCLRSTAAAVGPAPRRRRGLASAQPSHPHPVLINIAVLLVSNGGQQASSHPFSLAGRLDVGVVVAGSVPRPGLGTVPSPTRTGRPAGSSGVATRPAGLSISNGRHRAARPTTRAARSTGEHGRPAASHVVVAQ
jgi:hypothetical protein